MYQYTPALPQHPFPYFNPLYYPHHITVQSYDVRYMSGLYYSRTRRYNPYREASFPTLGPSFRPIQTDTQTYTSPAQTPQQDRTSRKNRPEPAVSKHVHFDLPDSPQSTSRTVKMAIGQGAKEMGKQKAKQQQQQTERLYPAPPPHPPTSWSRAPEEQYMSRTQYPSSLPYDRDVNQQRQNPNNTTVTPTRLTIYIISYSTDIIRSESCTIALLASQVPHRNPPIPHLYTIDARNMQPPSPALCARYSGIAPLIQDIVMQDAAAQKAVCTAVKELLRFGDEEEITRDRWRRGSPRLEVSISVCCHAGTHRSVAIAERIAQCVKRDVARLPSEEGVRVVCRHVHRIKGRADPF